MMAGRGAGWTALVALAVSTAPAVAGQPPAPGEHPAAQGEAALKAALAAVPASNRPVGMALRNPMSGGGGYPIARPFAWAVFANGWATRCQAWDPADAAPTPEALRGPPHGCNVAHWRKSGAGYAFETSPGRWETAGPAVLTGFSPGQRVELDLENISAHATPTGTAGLAVNAVSAGHLQMTAEGQITLASTTSVVVSGNQVGGGTTGHRKPQVGTYYLDGYLIAIADHKGDIHRGIIAQEDGAGAPTIYLDGEQFWPKRR